MTPISPETHGSVPTVAPLDGGAGATSAPGERSASRSQGLAGWLAPEGLGLVRLSDKTVGLGLGPGGFISPEEYARRMKRTPASVLALWLLDRTDLVPPTPDFSQGCHVLADLLARNERRKNP